ncbi:MAG TPA: DUF4097 family beta strand repeat-containing protein [Bryobacteraceae bacterium]|nr:DUF4097 family beta strand repeat-containing protein [Bryobacteraceae bacterium]
MRPRRSLTGPLILILIGVAFLTRNLWQEVPLFQLIAQYWPFLLIAWGVLRLLEVLIELSRSKPLPSGGLSGGEVALIILLCIIGSGMYAADRHGVHFPPFGNTSLEVFGEENDYRTTEEKSAPGMVHVVFENLRGNVRINGSDEPLVKVEEHKMVRAFNKVDADQADRQSPLEIVADGNRIVVRTNEDRVSHARRISCDLEVSLPRTASVEGRGTSGDYDVTDVSGSIDISSGNAGVRLTNIGGSTKVDLQRSDIVRAVDVKGDVDIEGRGNDIELENIAGQVTINGSYSGTLQFKNLAKPLHLESRNTDLKVEKVPGTITMDLGEFTGTNLVGPVRLITKSKDIHLEDFTQSLELDTERGDIELKPGKVPVAKIDARSRSGNIDLELPESAKFELKATTSRGEVQNEYGSPLEAVTEGEGGRLKGKVGQGPVLTITTDRGAVTVKKS